jgi:hypothetical protein
VNFKYRRDIDASISESSFAKRSRKCKRGNKWLCLC